MKRSTHLPLLLLPTFLLCLCLCLSYPVSADLFSLVYKGCASSQSTVPTSTLAALSSSLISKSSSSSSARFFKTTTSGDPPSLFGLFQCRGDLSLSDCSACVSRIPSLWVSLCGSNAAAARVQLTGCYALYQLSDFPQVSGTKMLYKSCSKNNAASDFEEKRGTALAGLQSGVVASGVGFYATSYSSVYAMAQCEGDLSAADCGECVAEAVQKAEVECGGASSGQMYLDKCYISYSYYIHGVPRDSGSSSDGGGGGNSGQPTGKTVAIVVGAAAGVGFVVICLLFVRSLYKKDDS